MLASVVGSLVQGRSNIAANPFDAASETEDEAELRAHCILWAGASGLAVRHLDDRIYVRFANRKFGGFRARFIGRAFGLVLSCVLGRRFPTRLSKRETERADLARRSSVFDPVTQRDLVRRGSVPWIDRLELLMGHSPVAAGSGG
jgi:hypothetical protein